MEESCYELVGCRDMNSNLTMFELRTFSSQNIPNSTNALSTLLSNVTLWKILVLQLISYA